jgi:hypothetical protein
VCLKKISIGHNCNYRANSKRFPVIKKQKETNQIVVYRNVRFLEAPKIVEKLSQSWWSNPAFSSGAASL